MPASRTGTSTYLRRREALKRKRLPCHICGLPIDYDAPRDDPEAFQADHLIAVARGGDDDGMLLASHRRCNLAKGTRPHAPIVRRSTTLN